MTVDRDRIRNDLAALEDCMRNEVEVQLHDYCVALLAELEAAEARLAKVPALVEAAKALAWPISEPSDAEEPCTRLRDALAAWDAA